MFAGILLGRSLPGLVSSDGLVGLQSLFALVARKTENADPARGALVSPR
jgi:hypothetical protein